MFYYRIVISVLRYIYLQSVKITVKTRIYLATFMFYLLFRTNNVLKAQTVELTKIAFVFLGA